MHVGDNIGIIVGRYRFLIEITLYNIYFCMNKALGDTVLPSTSPPVSGERKRFSDVTRLGFAAAHDSPSLALKQPSNNSQVLGSQSNLVSFIGKIFL